MPPSHGSPPRAPLPVGVALGLTLGAVASLALAPWPELRALAENRQPVELARVLAGLLLPGLGAGLVGGAVLGLELGRRGLRLPFGWVFVPLALVALAGTALAFLAPRLRPLPEGPNVLLVVLDTTRQDHLSLYGYERGTTPRLDALGEESAVFTEAYSTSSWTCSSHASLFTGLYPAAHRVTQEAWSMPAEHLTLAEVLYEHGYHTLGLVGNAMAGSGLGFAQGFETFRETWREEDDGDAARHPAVRGLEDLVAAGGRRPFFAFVNLIEPHSPYNEGPFLLDYARHPANPLTSNHWKAYFAGEGELGAEDLEHLADLHDGEIRYADAVVGALVDVLVEAALLEDTVVVVTADHGENFGEHGLVDHVFNLYEETTRIPLLIRYPAAFAPGRRADPVQLVDLVPTLLTLTGAPARGGLQGHDLTAGPAPDDRALLLSYGYPRQAFGAIEKQYPGTQALEPWARRLWALRRGEWKLILGDDGTRELYHLGRDPRELEDLAGTEGERAAELERELQSLLDAYTRGSARTMSEGDADLDPDTLEEMRKLGYGG